MSKYRTAPDHDFTGWPKGVPYIIGNEGCERFSFYGMKSILFIHLASLYVLAGQTEMGAKDAATSQVHLFIAGVYALPMIGALIAERLLGKYQTIIWLSLVYCAGHAVLAVGENSIGGMNLGLALIAIGSGGIKPCVSANVGDQFGRGNWDKVRTVFQMFYFIINFGSAFATIIIPWTKAEFGTSVAFGIPGILMFIATFFFWLGRKNFVHVPPHPGGKLGLIDTLSSVSFFLTFGHLFVTAGKFPAVALIGISVVFLAIGLVLFFARQKQEQDDGFLAVTLWTVRDYLSKGKEVFDSRDDGASEDALGLRSSNLWKRAVQKFGMESAEGPVAVFKIISVFFLVSVFWALFDQHSSSWIRQAEQMYLPPLPWNSAKTLLPSQLPAMNPFMVMALIPIMNIVYKLSEKMGISATPLRRMTIGMMMAAASFVAVALIQEQIVSQGDGKVHAMWQFVPYLIITTSEVMVSITGLEFAYTQAPRRMKSVIMGFWLLTVSFGNILVALLASLGDLPLAKFFWVFAVLMAAAGLLFGVRARFYKAHDYTQN